MVKKALAAVWRICDKGNIVQFGPEEADCFILNKETKQKVQMKKKKGSYVIEVEFVLKKSVVAAVEKSIFAAVEKNIFRRQP